MLSKATTTLLLGATAILAASVSADGAGGHPFGYKTATTDEMDAPEDWKDHYPDCDGNKQSPIDITIADACGEATSPPWVFEGECTTFNMTETGTGYTAHELDGNCTASANSVTYSLRQFHVHTPSEHMVAGKAFDGEVHFVHGTNGATHAEDNAKLMVVGVFLETSEETDPWLATVLTALGKVTEEAPVEDLTLSSYVAFAQQFADQGKVFNYAGSLTTPGCNEIVDWWVVATPAPISAEDLVKLQGYLAEIPITDDGKNARPVQPVNDRFIETFN